MKNADYDHDHGEGHEGGQDEEISASQQNYSGGSHHSDDSDEDRELDTHEQEHHDEDERRKQLSLLGWEIDLKLGYFEQLYIYFLEMTGCLSFNKKRDNGYSGLKFIKTNYD